MCCIMLLFSLPSHLSPPPPIPVESPLQPASEPRGLRRRRNGRAGLDPREGAEADRPDPGAGHGRPPGSSSRRSMMPAHPPLRSTLSSADDSIGQMVNNQKTVWLPGSQCHEP